MQLELRTGNDYHPPYVSQISTRPLLLLLLAALCAGGFSATVSASDGPARIEDNRTSAASSQQASLSASASGLPQVRGARASSSEPMPVPQLPQVYIDTTFKLPQGKTWQAYTSGEFQNALNSANPGDVIVLEAGATYVGNFRLPVKSNSSQQWIYIVGSALKNLAAPGTRVNPATDLASMPQIVTLNAEPAITIPPGASYYRLVGLEITSASTHGCDLSAVPPINCWTYDLVYVGGLPAQPLPNNITVDRCYLHGSATQDVRQGVIANGSSIAVIDSYISDIHESTLDSQAVLAYLSPGPLKIVDNYLSATTEDVMFGGGGGPNNPYIPSDIEFRNNLLFKPLQWAQPGVTLPPNNQWTEKNNLEFKSARRVLVDGNTLENTWVSGQTGYSVLFTVRTGQSGNLAVVDDITFTNNLLENVTSGFSTLYHDNSCGKPPYGQCRNQGEAKRILIYNNLILFREPQLPGTPSNSNWGLLLDPDMTDFVFQHNTTVPAPGTNCYQSIFFNVYQGTPWPPAQSITQNLWILDNALCVQPTGGFGGQGTKGLTYYMGDPAPLAPRYLGNVMYVPANQVEAWPIHNDATTVPFVYVNASQGDYQLAIPDWTQTSDGKPAGVIQTTDGTLDGNPQ